MACVMKTYEWFQPMYTPSGNTLTWCMYVGSSVLLQKMGDHKQWIRRCAGCSQEQWVVVVDRGLLGDARCGMQLWPPLMWGSLHKPHMGIAPDPSPQKQSGYVRLHSDMDITWLFINAAMGLTTTMINCFPSCKGCLYSCGQQVVTQQHSTAHWST